VTTRKERTGRIEKFPPQYRRGDQAGHPPGRPVALGPSSLDRADAGASEDPSRHFGTIESAHEYVALLLRAIEETGAEVGEDLHASRGTGSSRRREAFQLIAYKLEQLRFHLAVSRRRLNDLRTLRRLLHGERTEIALAS
jgi:hypothetical protein